MENFKKIVHPSNCKTWRKRLSPAYAEITYRDGKLSIHGVVGPFASGNCAGSAGQCVTEIGEGVPAKGWTKEMLSRFCKVWEEWHLNDMRAYCEHQKALGWREKANQPSGIKTSYGSEKTLGWLRPSEHPDGLLTRECPVCGYKYGTAWKFEAVPEDVLEFLHDLPETEKEPAWV